MKKVFVDGRAGTTGLRIMKRLEARGDIRLIALDDAQRRDIAFRKAALNEADAAFLCLPDDAAREAVALLENPDTVVLDASTAHRTDPGWAYGLPELGDEYAQRVKRSRRIAVPGCHATGFLALVGPLVAEGLIPKDALLSAFSLTGYSGGGKAMIAQYEGEGRGAALDAPRVYAAGQGHKHLPEMTKVAGLDAPPIFTPVVAGYYSGMLVTVPLHRAQVSGTPGDIRKIYRRRYAGPVVKYVEGFEPDGFLSANALSGRDDMEIAVFGNAERILLAARFDNLGKGASGAAVQCMNLSFGLDPAEGLILGGAL